MPSTKSPPLSTFYAVAFASMASLFTPAALACGKDQQQVFTCKTKNNKVVEVCNAGKDATYSFGRVGSKPDLFLRKPKTSLDLADDSATFSLTFPNGTTTYTIAYAGSPGPIAASVEVATNQRHIASVACVSGGVTANFTALGLGGPASGFAASAPTKTGKARWVVPTSEKSFKTSIGNFSIKSSDYSQQLLLNGHSLIGNTDFYDEKLDVGGVLDYGNNAALLIYTGNSGSGGYYRAVAVMVDSSGRITSFADQVDTDPASYKLIDGSWISHAKPIAGQPRRVSINQHGIRVHTVARAFAKGQAAVEEGCQDLYEVSKANCPNLRPRDCTLLATSQEQGVLWKTEARGSESSNFSAGEYRMFDRAFDDPGFDYVALLRTCAAACSATKMPVTLKHFEQKVCRGR